MPAVNHKAKMKRYVDAIIVLLLVGILPRAQSQNIYWSKNGTLSVIAPYATATITGHSKEVEVTLDYSTAMFTLTLPLGGIHTGVDSVDSVLQTNLKSKVVLKGVINSGSISITPHLLQQLLFTGMIHLERGATVPVKGTSRLEHIGGGEDLACKLALYFDVEIESLGLQNILKPVEANSLSVYFDDTILRRGN